MRFLRRLLLMGLCFVSGSTVFAKPPEATIYIVDSTGKPIAGALITPNGLRSKGGLSAFAWTTNNQVPPVPALTDEQGQATLPYPPFVLEKVETGAISFDVNHPDYVWAQGEQIVDPSPISTATVPKKAQFHWEKLSNPQKFHAKPFVLQRGASVMLSGFLGRKENVLRTNVFATPYLRLDWLSRDPGLLSSKKYPPGDSFVRLIHFPEKGRTAFSDVTAFNALATNPTTLHLELRKGHRLTVKLSTNVPRPVLNGRVALFVSHTNSVDPDSNAWRSWREVDTNGVCVFDSLPRGLVGIIGICDGYVSENGPITPNRSPSVCHPQRFRLKEDQTFELSMDKAASCEVLVLDPEGKPLRGARVGFSPNAIGFGIFARKLYNSSDLVRGTNSWKDFNTFSAETDANGVATIRTLPGFGMNQTMSVEHPQYVLPFNARNGEWRDQLVRLQSGKTSSLTVPMQKRGETAARDLP